MKIWLINPPVLRSRPSRIEAVVTGMFFNSPPLGLCYLAAVLEGDGHRVIITDAPVYHMTAADLATEARRLMPDLVGITATTPYFDQAVDTAAAVRSALPGIPIGIGGPHFNADPELLLRHHDFDFAVAHEGEYTLQEVVQNLEAGRSFEDVAGVVTRQGDELHWAEPRPFIEDLSVLPLPARHLIPMDSYQPLPNDQHRLPKAAMISSRGCPYRCIFCAKQTFGPAHRTNSPQRAIEEMHDLHDRYGMRDVAFVDSLFTPTKQRVRDMMAAMEANPVDMTWSCSCRAEVLDAELLERMKANGCWKIRIAIESGNADIRKLIKKGLRQDQFSDTVFAADRVGLQVKAFFMVGHIGDTEETIEDSIQLACSLPLTDVTVQINTPLMGTPQYEMCGDYGTLRTEDTSQYSFFEPVFVPHGLTEARLSELHRSFYRRFYLRPSLIRRRARHIRTPSDVTNYLRAIPLAANVMFDTMRGDG